MSTFCRIFSCERLKRRSVALEGEFHNLPSDHLELRFRRMVEALTCFVEQTSGCIEGYAERCRPATQRVCDGAKRSESVTGRLPTSGACDTADGETIKIDAWVAPHVLGIVKHVFDQPRNGAVIAR